MSHAWIATNTVFRAASRELGTLYILSSCRLANKATGRFGGKDVRRNIMTTSPHTRPCGMFTFSWAYKTIDSAGAAPQKYLHHGYATQARAGRGKDSQAKGSNNIQRLRPSEVVKIFGQLMEVNAGNNLLHNLQSHRIHGTLDKEIVQPGITPEMVNRGLAYLRRTYPLDEDAAILQRIEREEDLKEQKAQAEVEKAKAWAPQESTADDGIYGKSKVEEAVRTYNERMAKAAAQRKEREQRELESTQVVFEYRFVARNGEVVRQIDEVHISQRGNRTIRTIKNTSYAPRDQDPEEQLQKLSNESSVPGLIQTPNGMAVMHSRSERVKKENPSRHKWEKRAQLSNWDGVSEPPYMPWTKRWALPTLFMLLTVGGSLLFAQYYRPPPRSARLFPDIPPAASTILALMALNVAGFLLWKVPPLWRFMNKHMLVHAVIPKPSQLLGNIFSHQRTSHLAFNTFTLWWMGTQLCEDIGRGQFLSVYISGGVFAAWFSLMQAMATRNYLQASLGASGALCCVIACWLRLRDGGRVDFALWPGEWKPSFKSDQLLMILILVDVIGAAYYWRSAAGMIDHVCHVGGFLAGIGWSEWLLKKHRALLQERSRRRF